MPEFNIIDAPELPVGYESHLLREHQDNNRLDDSKGSPRDGETYRTKPSSTTCSPLIPQKRGYRATGITDCVLNDPYNLVVSSSPRPSSSPVAEPLDVYLSTEVPYEVIAVGIATNPSNTDLNGGTVSGYPSPESSIDLDPVPSSPTLPADIETVDNVPRAISPLPDDDLEEDITKFLERWQERPSRRRLGSSDRPRIHRRIKRIRREESFKG